MRLPSLLAIAVIRFYQQTVARFLPTRCRFHPTCSAYAVQSLKAKGLVRGGAAAIWRVARCGPWTRGGIDPVRTSSPAEAR